MHDHEKIPVGPPRTPASPFPEVRSRLPWAIPAGILSLMREDFWTRPSPPHWRQGLAMVWPLPPQVGQACWI